MFKVFPNLFFPRVCSVCNRALEDADLCEACLAKIPVFGWTFCSHCDSRLENFSPCRACSRLTALTGIGSATDYRRSDVRALIHTYKYRRRKTLARPLADMLLRHARLSGLAEHLKSLNATVTAIPITRHRELQRGFNQAALLAEIFAEELDLPYQPGILKRIAERPAQVTMPDAKSRRENIAGAFGPAKPALIQNNIFLLVDDVATSGATLEEASRTLKRAGAKIIWAITVARGH